ncbi:MAG: PDZ domain-containing protein [Bacteroidales bacterium]|nr:PDZ domain-containing protein [Bacteroidales bacterium]
MNKLILFLMLISPVAAATDGGTMLLRQPTIHGDHIVFVYANDLWLGSTAGGDAHRITSSTGAETNPHFSPDGEWIAFTGQYDGNSDVYLIPAEGGEPVRLTYHPGADIVQGWMPGNDRIVFQSGRNGHPTRSSRLYTVAVAGGTPKPLPVVRAAYGEVSPDARYLAYTPITFWDPEWRNYRGGQAQPIWIVDLETLSLQQTPRTDNERHMDPVWHGDKVFFISERDFASNIWAYDLTDGTVHQHTFHGDFDVKSIDSDGKNIVYEQGGRLHILNPATGNTTTPLIDVKGDFHWARERWEEINPARLTNGNISATGQRAIFEYRGEILTIPADKGSWRNITQTPGIADRYPVWSPKGDRIAWFSDKVGEYQLVIADQDGSNRKTIPIDNPSFFFRPEWSPDGKQIAFTDTHYNLWIVNIESDKSFIADSDNYAHPDRSMNPVWSPDSRWVAYAKILENQHKAIMVCNAETGERIQITDGMADAISPVWDKSGKYIFFLASTSFGLGTGWLDMSSYDVKTTRSLYLVLLSDKTPSPFLPTSDEEEPSSKQEADKKSESGKKSTRKESEQPDTEEAEEVKKVVIDAAGINLRIVAADISEGEYTALLPGPEGTLFIVQNQPGSRGSNLMKYTVTDNEAKTFMENFRQGKVSADRQKILWQSGNNWGITDTKQTPVKTDDDKIETTGLMVKVDPSAEWQQIFREGWRYQRDFLYVDNTHGAPWNDVFEWYSPWVKHVRHRAEMNYIIDILGGEIAVGHSYTSGGDFPEVKSVPVGLLGADYKAAEGRYMITRIYTAENWNPSLVAPLGMPGMDVAEGDFLIAVNNRQITDRENLYSFFEGTAGTTIKLTVSKNADGSDSRDLTVKPVSNENQLRTTWWVESNRRLVDSLSQGKLAYVWLPNTGAGGYSNFNRYYFAQQDRQGAIIDERNNGGGSAADYIVDVLSRELIGYFNSRTNTRRPFTTPMAGLWGPKVMIINERAGSGGDLMPYLFREMGIGPLVGTLTWGGLVGTWDTPPFIDGGRMVAPRGGFYDRDGKWAIEGEGVAPDIEVMQDPAMEAAGRDPQLEKAVSVALELIEKEGIKLMKEPAAPVRWKRPDYFFEK